MATQTTDEHERAAAGLDFEDEPGAHEHGPEAILNEIEEMLPEAWREHIKSFPIVAVALGVGVGIFLGMKKSDEIIAAGTSFVSAAAMANVTQVMERMKKE